MVGLSKAWVAHFSTMPAAVVAVSSSAGRFLERGDFDAVDYPADARSPSQRISSPNVANTTNPSRQSSMISMAGSRISSWFMPENTQDERAQLKMQMKKCRKLKQDIDSMQEVDEGELSAYGNMVKEVDIDYDIDAADKLKCVKRGANCGAALGFQYSPKTSVLFWQLQVGFWKKVLKDSGKKTEFVEPTSVEYWPELDKMASVTLTSPQDDKIIKAGFDIEKSNVKVELKEEHKGKVPVYHKVKLRATGQSVFVKKDDIRIAADNNWSNIQKGLLGSIKEDRLQNWKIAEIQAVVDGEVIAQEEVKDDFCETIQAVRDAAQAAEGVLVQNEHGATIAKLRFVFTPAFHKGDLVQMVSVKYPTAELQLERGHAWNYDLDDHGHGLLSEYMPVHCPGQKFLVSKEPCAETKWRYEFIHIKSKFAYKRDATMFERIDWMLDSHGHVDWNNNVMKLSIMDKEECKWKIQEGWEQVQVFDVSGKEEKYKHTAWKQKSKHWMSKYLVNEAICKKFHTPLINEAGDTKVWFYFDDKKGPGLKEWDDEANAKQKLITTVWAQSAANPDKCKRLEQPDIAWKKADFDKFN